MDESLKLTLSRTSSILETHYFPPIKLSPTKNYALGLVEFLTFNSIPNVDIGQNKFSVYSRVHVCLPAQNKKKHKKHNISLFCAGRHTCTSLYNKEYTIPKGSYEINDIQRYLQKVLVNEGIEIHIKPNNKIR